MTTRGQVLLFFLGLFVLIAGIFWNATGKALIPDPIPLTFEACIHQGGILSTTTPRTCTSREGIPFTEGIVQPSALSPARE